MGKTYRRGLCFVVVAASAVVLAVVAASFFMPVGGRAGAILDAPTPADAWRLGLTRGVACYRRETPSLMGGQLLSWEPTLTGPDPFGPWHRDVSWWRVVWIARDKPGKVVEVRVPAWPLAVAFAAWAGWLVRRWRVAAGRGLRGECVRCGYPRAGSGACTECGCFENHSLRSGAGPVNGR